MHNLTNLDRPIGVLVGSACGDALGAGYEFTQPRPDTLIVMEGGGLFRWAPGEWTDDTQMSICIAEEAATDTLDPLAVGDRFLDWLASDPPDVGLMTSSVLGAASTGADLPRAAIEYSNRRGRCGGNGSLMRTAPVALALLGDRDAIARSARSISDLTHADPDAGDACVLWCLAIDHAIATGELDVRAGLSCLPLERRNRWAGLIDEAEQTPMSEFTGNGWVVRAFQAAWAAITQTPIPQDRPGRHLPVALEAAVRIGDDTDTVAAIAGALLGARWGVSAVPAAWKALLHGWPGYDARDLTRLAMLAANGHPDSTGWPTATSMIGYYEDTWAADPIDRPLRADPGVTMGNVFASPHTDADVIVSLCRMGSEPLRPSGRHVDIMLIDHTGPAVNPNLLQVLEDTSDAIAGWRTKGLTVFLHCVHAHNRTPVTAAAYLIRRFGMTPEGALNEVQDCLGNGPDNPTILEALRSIKPFEG